MFAYFVASDSLIGHASNTEMNYNTWKFLLSFNANSYLIR